MAIVIGIKNIKREITFDAEGDLGEKVPSTFVLVVERPSKPVCKEFSLLFAKFADVLSAVNNADEKQKQSVESFTNNIDEAEQALADFVQKKIAGWQDVMMPDGQPLAFTEENLQSLFNDREARRAVFEDYQELVTGRKKAAEKNLEKQEKAG